MRIVLAVAVLCCWTGSFAAENAVTLRFYRNLFSRSLLDLETIEADGEEPDEVRLQDDWVIRSPWFTNQVKDISRCSGETLAGKVKVGKTGKCVFVIPEPKFKCRILLATDGDPKHAKEIAFTKVDVLDPPDKRLERSLSRDRKKPEPAKGKAAVSEEFAFTKGQALYLKVFYIEGWGTRFSLGWAWKKNADGLWMTEEVK